MNNCLERPRSGRLRFIENTLGNITFAPSCVDMGWRWEVNAVDDLGGPEGYLLRTTFQRPDRETGKIETGFGRWWHVPEDVSETGIVKTAFAAAKLILEHELMESFRYGNVRLFDPHHDVADLRRAAAR